MPTTYNADGTQPVATKKYAPVNIASSTNASPIVITTSGSHGFANGDTVEIEGHLVNTAANGFFQVTVASATSFALNGSTGNGVGGATGYAIDYSVGPLITLPSDGDTQSVSTVNPAFEGIFNLAPYFYKRVGAERLYFSGQAGAGSMFGSTSTTALNASTWTALTGMSAIALTPTSPNTQTMVLKAGDRLRLTWSGTLSLGAGAVAAVGFGISLSGGAANALQDSSLYTNGGASGIVVPCTLTTDYVYANPSDTYAISIMGLASTGTPSLLVTGYWKLCVMHYRSNA